MARTRAVLAFLHARPSRRPHEVLAWIAALLAVVAAAGASPWVPWPRDLGLVVLVAAGAGAVVAAVCAASAYVAARR